MVGVGITPEGINQNYIMYEFALDRAWYQNEVNVSDWINQYIEVRYGFQDDNLSLAWQKIRVIFILKMNLCFVKIPKINRFSFDRKRFTVTMD